MILDKFIEINSIKNYNLDLTINKSFKKIHKLPFIINNKECYYTIFNVVSFKPSVDNKITYQKIFFDKSMNQILSDKPIEDTIENVKSMFNINL
jgi:hypothetical protein